MKLVLLSLVCITWVTSCAKKEESVSVERVSHGDPLLDKYASNHSYGKTGGIVRSHSEKQSQFQGKSFHGINDFSGKNYTTKEYNNKRWWGKKSYGSKEYAGKTDGSRFQYSPDFVQRQAQYQSKKSRASGQRYNTNGFAKKEAYQNSAKRFDRPESYYAKRDNIDDPIIIPWKDQPGASLTGVRQMMGREDD